MKKEEMTREEAIKIFNTVLFLGKCDCPKEEIKECLKMAIKALEQEPKWIPVSERLPEKDVECMVVYCSEDGIVGTCMYYNAFNQFKGSIHPETAFDDIVAWMPIEPYKQEGKG